jgi:group I intron endonuclease
MQNTIPEKLPRKPGKFYTYIITNIINGNKYVGKTKCPYTRWMAHKNAALKNDAKKYSLHNAMAKHGLEYFTFEIIGVFETEKQSFENEIKVIDGLKKLNTLLYNNTIGGEGTVGYKATDELKEHYSSRMKNFHSDPNNVFYQKTRMSRKLSDDDVIFLRKALTEQTMTAKDIGRKFKINHKAVFSIGLGKTYKDVDYPPATVIKNQFDRLTCDKVKKIREEISEGLETPTSIAAKYNMSYAAAYSVALGKSHTDTGGELYKPNKITPEIVLGMRCEFASGKYTRKEISKKFNFCEGLTLKILTGDLYLNYGGPIADKVIIKKLTDNDIVNILKMYNQDKISEKEIAIKYGLSEAHTVRILKGKHFENIYNSATIDPLLPINIKKPLRKSSKRNRQSLIKSST